MEIVREPKESTSWERKEISQDPLSAQSDRNGMSIDQTLLRQYADLPRFLWKARGILCYFFLAGGIVALGIALALPKLYTATTRLMPPDNQSGSLRLMASLGSAISPANLGLAGGLLGLKNSGALYIGVLQSRTVQDDIIARFDLKKVYSVPYMDGARKSLSSATSINEDRQSGILEIKVTDRDPRRAFAISQAYVDDLNRLLTELNTSSAHRERTFLEERLRDIKKDLNIAATNLSNFSSKKAAIDLPEQGKVMLGAAARLEGELIAAQTELQGLKQTYSGNNITVLSLEARIVELRRQISKITGRDFETISGDHDLIPSSIRSLPQLAVSYADLYRQFKIQETMFEVLTKQYELAKVDEAKELPIVRVLDLPEVPEHKSSPPRALITVLGAGVSLMLGLAWLLGLRLWRSVYPLGSVRDFAREIFY